MVDVILAIIWIAILVLYIVVGWKDAKSNNEVKKEITQMNELLLEQNSQLKEQNKHLNMVILSVCSKSVRDRKDQEEKHEKDSCNASGAGYVPVPADGLRLQEGRCPCR